MEFKPAASLLKPPSLLTRKAFLTDSLTRVFQIENVVWKKLDFESRSDLFQIIEIQDWRFIPIYSMFIV